MMVEAEGLGCVGEPEVFRVLQDRCGSALNQLTNGVVCTNDVAYVPPSSEAAPLHDGTPPGRTGFQAPTAAARSRAALRHVLDVGNVDQVDESLRTWWSPAVLRPRTGIALRHEMLMSRTLSAILAATSAREDSSVGMPARAASRGLSARSSS